MRFGDNLLDVQLGPMSGVLLSYRHGLQLYEPTLPVEVVGETVSDTGAGGHDHGHLSASAEVPDLRRDRARVPAARRGWRSCRMDIERDRALQVRSV
jgi:hypothetical protein